MSTVSRDKLKKHGIKRLINSFKYAIDGLKYAFTYEQNILVHVIITIVVLLGGIFLKISFFEWLILFIVIGLVIATELINTAIEATIDLITNEINPLAKVAKDTAAAAVLVFSLVALIVGLLIFVPKIIEGIGGIV